MLKFTRWSLLVLGKTMLVGAHYLLSFHKLHLLWWHELLMVLLFAICEQGKNIYKRNIYSKLSVRDIYTTTNMWCVNLVIAWVDSSAKRETRRVVLETYIQQKQAQIVFLFTFSIRVSKLYSPTHTQTNNKNIDN